MRIKRFYDIIDAEGNILDRDELLASPAAHGAAAELAAEGVPGAASAARIFGKLKDRGVLSDIKPRPVVEVSQLTDRQTFSARLIKGGEGEGWLARNDEGVTIRTTDGGVHYDITRIPGRYCCHTGKYLGTPDGDGALAREYIAKNFPDTPSPDANWPHGYEVLNGFECTLVKE